MTDSECAILRGLPLYRICREDQGSDNNIKGYVSIGNRTRKGLGQGGSTASTGDVSVLFDTSPSRPYCTLRQLDAPALSRGCVLFPPHLLTHTPSEPSDLALLERLGTLHHLHPHIVLVCLTRSLTIDTYDNLSYSHNSQLSQPTFSNHPRCACVTSQRVFPHRGAVPSPLVTQIISHRNRASVGTHVGRNEGTV